MTTTATPTSTGTDTDTGPTDREISSLLIKLGCRNTKKHPKLAAAIRSILLEFQLSTDRLHDSWEAYAINLINSGDSGDFTLDHIDQFRSYLRVNASISVNVLGKRSLSLSGELHGHGVSITPKKPILVSSSSAQQPDFLSPLTVMSSSSTPVSNTSSATRVSMSPNGNYTNRRDSGRVMLEFNKNLLHCEPSDQGAVEVEFSEFNMQDRDYMVPCVNLAKIVASEKERIVELGQAILDREELMFTQCNIPSTGAVTTYGRVCNEASTGSLNKASVILEGHSGARVKLDLNGMTTIPPLFPGQVIAVQGQNPSGRVLHAENIWDGLDGKVAPQATPVDDLSMIVAVGPFTDKGLDFAPLGDLLNGEVVDFKPKLLVLMGPFCHGDAVLELEDGETLHVDSENFFAQKVSVALEEMLRNCPNTQVILVPSVDDPIGSQIYPQPPLKSRKSSGKIGTELLKTESLDYVMTLGNLGLPKSNRLHVTSNPSSFSVNLLNPVTPEKSCFNVSLTSLDMIRWINKDVIKGYISPTDRIVNVIESGIIAQRSMYPLRTAEHAGNVPIDFTEYSNFSLSFEHLPDLLIVPSVVRTSLCTLLKGGTVLLNPGFLLRGGNGGTYAKISIREGKVKADVVKI